MQKKIYFFPLSPYFGISVYYYIISFNCCDLLTVYQISIKVLLVIYSLYKYIYNTILIQIQIHNLRFVIIRRTSWVEILERNCCCIYCEGILLQKSFTSFDKKKKWICNWKYVWISYKKEEKNKKIVNWKMKIGNWKRRLWNTSSRTLEFIYISKLLYENVETLIELLRCIVWLRYAKIGKIKMKNWWKYEIWKLGWFSGWALERVFKWMEISVERENEIISKMCVYRATIR